MVLLKTFSSFSFSRSQYCNGFHENIFLILILTESILVFMKNFPHSRGINIVMIFMKTFKVGSKASNWRKDVPFLCPRLNSEIEILLVSQY